MVSVYPSHHVIYIAYEFSCHGQIPYSLYATVRLWTVREVSLRLWLCGLLDAVPSSVCALDIGCLRIADGGRLRMLDAEVV